MTQLATLTVRTNAALGRLAELQRRADRIPAATTPLVRPALTELSAALEELQVANEQLQAYLEELASTRARADEMALRLDEFVQAVPVACIWTDPNGMILEANEMAAVLLNVARARLPRKPLMLFLADRARFFEALAALAAPGGGAVEMDMLVRPRERRPKRSRLSGRVMSTDSRWCWFLRGVDETNVAPTMESTATV